jgi:DNA-binding beta-propeller fold protein YncE
MRPAFAAAALLLLGADGRAAPPAPLRLVADVPLPGSATRFDYQSLDETRGRLYLAHMGGGDVLAFDIGARRVVASASGLPGVTGVLAVPALDRVYASATGLHRVAILTSALAPVARVGRIGFPDGLAYAPSVRKIYVSDESGGGELVIDAARDRDSGTIPLGGEAGNTVYEPRSGRILVALQTRNELAAIDPAADRVVARVSLAGADRPHGMLVDTARHRLFVANERSATLFVVDLTTMRVTGRAPVGDEPDVLAYDTGLGRLYVAAESGNVTVLDVRGAAPVALGTIAIPHAHSVSVSPTTHLVYLPLQSVNGRPVLRIMAPADRP